MSRLAIGNTWQALNRPGRKGCPVASTPRRRVSRISHRLSFLFLVAALAAAGCGETDSTGPTGPLGDDTSCASSFDLEFGVGPSGPEARYREYQFSGHARVYFRMDWTSVRDGDELTLWVKADSKPNPYTETIVVPGGHCGAYSFNTDVEPVMNAGRFVAKALRNGVECGSVVFYH